jgi:hypothetical protein
MAKTIYHGEVLGSTDPKQLPDVSYRYGYIKAERGNSGNVYIGSSSDVELIGSTDDTTTGGFELDAGEVLLLDVLPVDGHGNLNEHWIICDNAGDDIVYYLVDW